MSASQVLVEFYENTQETEEVFNRQIEFRQLQKEDAQHRNAMKVVKALHRAIPERLRRKVEEACNFTNEHQQGKDWVMWAVKSQSKGQDNIIYLFKKLLLTKKELDQLNKAWSGIARLEIYNEKQDNKEAYGNLRFRLEQITEKTDQS